MLEMEPLPPVATNAKTLPDVPVHTIEIQTLPIQPGAISGRYRVWQDGTVLIERARDPEHEACRELATRGLTGRVETRWRGKPGVAMRMDIAVGAKLTVGIGLLFRTWQPDVVLEAVE